MTLFQKIKQTVQGIMYTQGRKRDVISTSQASDYYLQEQEGYKAIMHRDNTLCLPVVMVL
jgi:hypothetical protein